MKKIILGIPSFLFAILAFGQNHILIENFDYPSGNELRSHGWTAHSAGATNPLKVVAPGLSLKTTKYIGKNTGNAVAVNNTGSDENKPFSKFVDSGSAGSVYAAFLVKTGREVTSSGSGAFLHFATYSNIQNPVYSAVSTSWRARTYIAQGSNASFFKLGLTFNSATVPSATGTDLSMDLDTSKTYLVVVKYTFVKGQDNDSVSMYIFKDGDDISEEPAKPTLGPMAGTASDAVVLQGIALRQFHEEQNIILDGIYVATEWDFEDEEVINTREISKSNSVYIYPNPLNSEILFVKGSSASAFHIVVHDAFGKILLETSTPQSQIDLSGLSSGLYFVRLEQSGMVQTQKLVIE